jgi:hypothetical protein
VEQQVVVRRALTERCGEPGAVGRVEAVEVGTAQLRERLASRYGDAAHFELAALPEGGTLAKITIANAG